MNFKSKPYLTSLTIVLYFFTELFCKKRISLYISLLISGLSIFSLRLSKIIELLWYKMSYILSKIIPNFLLFIVFFFVLSPLAFFSRILKLEKDFKIMNNDITTYKKVNKSFRKESFKTQW